MNVFQSQANLRKPVKNLSFGEVLASLILNHFLQVPSISIVHNNAQLAFLGLVDFSEPNDIGVVEHFQDLSFFQSVLLFLCAHSGYVHLFYHC